MLLKNVASIDWFIRVFVANFYLVAKKIKIVQQPLKQDHFKVATGKKEDQPAYLSGRGAQINTKNRFLKNENTREHIEGIDDWEESNVTTSYLEQESKTIVNKVESPDVGMS